MVYVDGVSLDEYKKVVDKFNEKIDKQAEKSMFNENVLLSMNAVKENGNYECLLTYVGKDYKLREEKFPFSCTEDIAKKFQDGNFYCVESGYGSYHDKDAGVAVVSDNSFTSLYSLTTDIGTCAFDESVDDCQKLYDKYSLLNKTISYVDYRRIIRECPEAADYLKDAPEKFMDSLVEEYKPSIDLVYNERNWREDYCVVIESGTTYEFSLEYDRQIGKMKYSHDSVEKDEKGEPVYDRKIVENLDGLVHLDGNANKENNGIMYTGYLSNFLVAKDLQAAVSFMDSRKDVDSLFGNCDALYDVCRSGMKSLGIEYKPGLSCYRDDMSVEIKLPEKQKSNELGNDKSVG